MNLRRSLQKAFGMGATEHECPSIPEGESETMENECSSISEEESEKTEAKDLQNNRAADESSSSRPRPAMEETNEIQAAKTAGGIAGSSATSSGGRTHPRRLPRRASVAIRSYHANNACILGLEKPCLASQAAFRGDHLGELRRAARSTNGLIRSHYKEFIEEVGRNVYPLIVFTDYEVDGPSGVGSTLTLYREDGSVTKVSPALHSNYELYKVCGHLLLGLGVEVGPYLANASLCCGSIVGGDEGGFGGEDAGESAGDAGIDKPGAKVEGGIEDLSWRPGLRQYLHHVRIYRQALINAVEAEAAKEGADNMADLSIGDGESGEEQDKIKTTPRGLPPLEMRETMFAIMDSVIDFVESCLSTGLINIDHWRGLNNENFPRLKACMKAATKAQADACVRQIVQWRAMMGAAEWRDLLVVIPTVWAVGGENPRKTMFRQLMDPDRVDTHIITTEWPRDHAEARTLLGRVVGDRAIGRFVFGDATQEQRVKVMGLSSEVDVVQDDALPAIWDAMERNGCPVRKNPSSARMMGAASAMGMGSSSKEMLGAGTSRRSMFQQSALDGIEEMSSSFGPSFC